MIEAGSLVKVICEGWWKNEEGIVHDEYDSSVGTLYGVRFPLEIDEVIYFRPSELEVIDV